MWQLRSSRATIEPGRRSNTTTLAKEGFTEKNSDNETEAGNISIDRGQAVRSGGWTVVRMLETLESFYMDMDEAFVVGLMKGAPMASNNAVYD